MRQRDAIAFGIEHVQRVVRAMHDGDAVCGEASLPRLPVGSLNRESDEVEPGARRAKRLRFGRFVAALEREERAVSEPHPDAAVAACSGPSIATGAYPRTGSPRAAYRGS